jgi:hypothetical protein
VRAKRQRQQQRGPRPGRPRRGKKHYGRRNGLNQRRSFADKRPLCAADAWLLTQASFRIDLAFQVKRFSPRLFS